MFELRSVAELFIYNFHRCPEKLHLKDQRRASDKFITEQCGILENLIPGDIILADHGFTIEDSVGLYCAQVVVPPFTKGIHVERAISLLKAKYTILKGVIPISLLKNNCNDICTIDCMLTVCSALCDMCESVVPFNTCMHIIHASLLFKLLFTIRTIPFSSRNQLHI